MKFGQLVLIVRRRLIRPLLQRLCWWWHRQELEAWQLVAKDALAIQDLGGVLHAFAQQQRFEWPYQIEGLLFDRMSRPTDDTFTLALLRGVEALPHLRDHHRFYAAVAAGYLALMSDDEKALEGLRLEIEIRAGLDQICMPFRGSGHRNREHEFKQMISARVCLLQFALREGDQSLAHRIAQANLYLMKSILWNRPPADVLYRSTSNAVRGLMPLALDPVNLPIFHESLSQLHQELSRPRYRSSISQAKENHLAFLQEVLVLLNTIHTDGRSVQSLQACRQLMINCSAEGVSFGAMKFYWVSGG